MFNVEDIMSYSTGVTVPEFVEVVEVRTDDFDAVGLHRGDVLVPMISTDQMFEDFLWEHEVFPGRKIVFNEEMILRDNRFKKVKTQKTR